MNPVKIKSFIYEKLIYALLITVFLLSSATPSHAQDIEGFQFGEEGLRLLAFICLNEPEHINIYGTQTYRHVRQMNNLTSLDKVGKGIRNLNHLNLVGVTNQYGVPLNSHTLNLATQHKSPIQITPNWDLIDNTNICNNGAVAAEMSLSTEMPDPANTKNIDLVVSGESVSIGVLNPAGNIITDNLHIIAPIGLFLLFILLILAVIISRRNSNSNDVDLQTQS